MIYIVIWTAKKLSPSGSKFGFGPVKTITGNTIVELKNCSDLKKIVEIVKKQERVRYVEITSVIEISLWLCTESKSTN